MKKQLLLGSALFAAISAFPQASRTTQNSGTPYNLIKERAERNAVGVNETRSPMLGSGEIQPTNDPSARPASPTSVSWKLLTGSSNVNGMVVNSQRPLQYNPALKAISFVHRKSDHYMESPALPSTAKTGVIVAEISTDMGVSFDSTCFWADPTQWGRYPQGAIYNPTGNTNIANAYVVGSGPTVSGSNFTGNWYASKQLNSLNATASTVPGAQQFLSFTLGTYPPNQPPHGWSRNAFSVTDDGIAHALGCIEDDLTGLVTVRGWAVITGSFTGSAFSWKIDTVTPACFVDATGNKHLNADAQMAWNQSGTVGYIVGTGALASTTLCNRSYQPIVYKMDKTTNPAATWTLMTGIDFNSTAMRPIVASYPVKRIGLAPMHVIGNDTVGVPFVAEYDIAVDSHNKLHIGAIFCSAFSDLPDSLAFISNFTTSINPTEAYKWRHINGNRPYIYDFYGDGNTFAYKVVDSVATEGPGIQSGRPGFNENPWDINPANNNLKVSIEPRLEMGRTPDGKHIYFSWVESDTLFTSNAFKWNNLPDIKTRMMAVESGTYANAYVMDLGTEQNMTIVDNNVRTRATLHYMSPTCSSATITTLNPLSNYTVDVFVPFTVTNSNPYAQQSNNSTWFGSGNVTFIFPPLLIDGIEAHANAQTLSTTYVYPNPTRGSAVVAMVLDNSSVVTINVMNTVGQTVKTVKVSGQVGENKIPFDVSDLSTGIYLINVKAGTGTVTKKLIVE